VSKTNWVVYAPAGFSLDTNDLLMPRMDTSDPAPHGPSPTSDRLSLDSRVLNDEGERLSKSKPDYQVPSLDLSDPFAVTILTVAAFAAGLSVALRASVGLRS